MTLRASSTENNAAFELFKYSVRRNNELTVLITICMLIVFPGYIFSEITRFLGREPTDINGFNLVTRLPSYMIFITVITCMSAVLYLFVNFAFLYTRNSSDFYHALPLKRKDLLISRFAASVLPVFIPTVATYAAIMSFSFIDRVKSDNIMILRGMALNLAVIVVASAFTLIFMICAGSIFDFLVSFFVFNIGSLVAAIFTLDLCDSLLKGFTASSADGILEITLPIYHIFAKCFEFQADKGSPDGILVYILKVIAFIAVTLGISILLYRKRKSEKSGVAYAYRFIYIICTFIAAYVGAAIFGSLFADGDKNLIYWIFAAVGGPLTAVIFGAVTERGFKKVKKSILIGASASVTLFVAAVVFFSGCFGFETRIPDKNKIKSAEIYTDTIELNNADIDLVTRLHNKITNPESDEFNSYIDLKYNLKNGGSLERAFHINEKELIDDLMAIYKSPENIKAKEKEFDEISKSSNIFIRVNSYDRYGEYTDHIASVYISQKELEGLKNAYISDMPNASENVIIEDYNDIYTYVYIDAESSDNGVYNTESVELDIKEDFYNTLDYLDSLDLHSRVMTDEEIYYAK